MRRILALALLLALPAMGQEGEYPASFEASGTVNMVVSPIPQVSITFTGPLLLKARPDGTVEGTAQLRVGGGAFLDPGGPEGTSAAGLGTLRLTGAYDRRDGSMHGTFEAQGGATGANVPGGMLSGLGSGKGTWKAQLMDRQARQIKGQFVWQDYPIPAMATWPWTIGGQAGCALETEWHPSPALEVERPLALDPPQLEPGVEVLMSPSAQVGLSCLARDRDTLVVRCVKAGLVNVEPLGPMADAPTYTWTHKGPGRLHAGDGGSAVFQLPLQPPASPEPQTAVIECRVGDSGKLATDPAIVGRVTLTLAWRAGRYGVTSVVQPLEPVPSQAAPRPAKLHDCVLQRKEWSPSQALSGKVEVVDVSREFHSRTGAELPRTTCLARLVLLRADYRAVDSLTLQCGEAGPEGPEVKLEIPDGLSYEWRIVKGQGSFPLGSQGPVVALLRTTESDLEVACEVRGSGTHAVAHQVVSPPAFVGRRHKPLALVGMGNIEHLWGDLPGIAVLADQVAAKYRQAGYEVRLEAQITREGLVHALQDPCLQALWLVGHGAKGVGNLGLAGDRLPGDMEVSLPASSVSSVVSQAWAVPPPHPFLQEVVLHSCYSGQALDEWSAVFRPGALKKVWEGKAFTLRIWHDIESWESTHQPVPPYTY